jgi:hypothetical protein
MKVEPSRKPTDGPNYSADSVSKDLEVQSLPSSSSDHNVHDMEEKGGRTMTEKGDIEAYPDGLNDPQNQVWSGKEGTVTRTNTKSSWKDPGPPPDGGLSGWTQGMYIPLLSS